MPKPRKFKVMPDTMPNVAPKEAPDETPNTWGSAKAFLKIA